MNSATNSEIKAVLIFTERYDDNRSCLYSVIKRLQVVMTNDNCQCACITVVMLNIDESQK